MSQWGGTPWGAQKRSDFPGTDQSEGYYQSYSQQIPPSQTPDQSSSCQSSQDDYPSILDDPRTRIASRPRITPERLTHSTAPPRASSAFFTLPSLSPPSPAAYTLRPIALPSPGSGQFGNLAHGQQSSDPATQILQHKNANLVSAYSSAQIRIADLGEEARASKLEITKLVKDQQRLRAKIDVLEAEINELHYNIEIAQQHTATKDAQYSQMVELSTKLQSHGTADAQRHKAQQEQWAHEKGEMERLINMMRSEIESLRSNSRRTTTPQPCRSGLPKASLTMTDPGGREAPSNINIQDALNTLQKEHAHLVNHLEKLGTAGRKMQTYLQDIGTDDLAADMLED